MSLEKKLGIGLIGVLLAAFCIVLSVRISNFGGDSQKVDVDLSQTNAAIVPQGSLPGSASPSSTAAAAKPTMVAEQPSTARAFAASGATMPPKPNEMPNPYLAKTMPSVNTQAGGNMTTGGATGSPSASPYTVTVTPGTPAAASQTAKMTVPSTMPATPGNDRYGDRYAAAAGAPPTFPPVTNSPPTMSQAGTSPAAVSPYRAATMSTQTVAPATTPSGNPLRTESPAVASRSTPPTSSMPAAASPYALPTSNGTTAAGSNPYREPQALQPTAGAQPLARDPGVAVLQPSAASPMSSPPAGYAAATSANAIVAAPATTTATPSARSYTVAPGDSFWSIAQQAYGDGAFYRALFAYNSDRYPHAEDVRVGSVLDVPPVETLKSKFPELCGPTTSAVTAAAGGSPTTGRSNVTVGAKTYVVQEGDTLFDIARRQLGKASYWSEIYNLNKAALGENLDNLRPGTELVLPNVSGQ